jgi:hypothetical protein
MRSRRESGVLEGEERGASGTAPGRVTRTQRLSLQLKLPAAWSAASTPATSQQHEEHEDPFGLHLIGHGDRVAAGPDKQGNDPAVERELERLIEMAEWQKLRPAAFAEASVATEARARERREGDAPDLTGIGSVKSLDGVARALKSMQGLWPSLSLDERKAQIQKHLDAELKAADIPLLEGIRDVPGKHHPASFDFRNWKIVIRTELIAGQSLDDEEGASLCEVLAHELRHAEQQWLTARFLAAQGRSVPEIVSTLDGISAPVAARAKAKKLSGLGSDEVAHARKMHTALVTDREINRMLNEDNGEREMEIARERARVMLVSLRRRPPAVTTIEARAVCRELRERIEDVLLKYKIYRQLPAEADSHDVGAGAKLAFEERS